MKALVASPPNAWQAMTFSAISAAVRSADVQYYSTRRALELQFGLPTIDTDAALAGLGAGPIPQN